MNQLLLFLRSIAVYVVLFLVLAFFAAKFFGGTLFPKPPRVDFPAVTVGGHAYFLSVTREEGKTPAFSLRQVDATDPGNSVLVAPQSGNDADAWAWAEVMRPEAAGTAGAGGTMTVRFTQRNGKAGACAVQGDGKVEFRVDQ